MCGIAGWIDFNQDISNKEEIISRMSDTLAKRGPDESGTYRDRNALLAHRRLIVIDPHGGRQPMNYETLPASKKMGIKNVFSPPISWGKCKRKFSELSVDNKKYTLIYNGELYNTKEIRDELISKGHRFQGYSDTEVILKAYVQWQEGCTKHLNGIFAFAVWESKQKKLFLARDRIGVKPLFFYPYKGGIIFGSEVKTLLAHPEVKAQINEDGLREIFLLGPARSSGQGIIKGVKELRPGEYLTAIREKTVISSYWSLQAKEFTDSFSRAKEKVRHLVCDAITRQLISDVPLCCFLSGGLDSSIISYFASNYYKKQNKGSLSTYCVDYEDNQKYFTANSFQPNSDDGYIKIMSEYINSNHKTVTLDTKNLADALKDALIARDLPGMADVDSSLLLFCKEVKKDFTVALSGECADEIFGGYPWYHNKEILFEKCFPWARSLDVRKSILKPEIFTVTDEYVYECYSETVSKTSKLTTDNKLESRMREMFMLNMDWFMQTLLDRKDRMSMFSGLEVRVPFCDYKIVEYAYNMPWEIKSCGGREKGILREAMKGILPEEIVNRKKSPYPKTHNPLYMRIVSERVRAILEEKNSLINQFLDKKGVLSIIENPQGIKSPWYGQLMNAPQILAYIIQVDCWMKKYKIQVV